jgi:hypothetical protein
VARDRLVGKSLTGSYLGDKNARVELGDYQILRFLA